MHKTYYDIIKYSNLDILQLVVNVSSRKIADARIDMKLSKRKPEVTRKSVKMIIFSFTFA